MAWTAGFLDALLNKGSTSPVLLKNLTAVFERVAQGGFATGLQLTLLPEGLRASTAELERALKALPSLFDYDKGRFVGAVALLALNAAPVGGAAKLLTFVAAEIRAGRIEKLSQVVQALTARARV
jgi:hypothetical protein